jgi:type VI secretion system secreted protein VgrG
MELEHAPLPIVDYAVRIEPRNTEATGAQVLEDGDLLVRSVMLEESLDGLYQLRLTLLADLGTVDVDPEALLEAEVTLRITRGDYERRVHGVVARVGFTGPEDDAVCLRLTIVPAIAFLSRWKRSRVFQDLSVVDIVSELVHEDLAVYNRSIDTSLLTRAHDVRDYCVQYRETDLQFVQRILAEEGIFLLLDHSDDNRERIVLIDAPSSFVSIGFEPLDDDPGGHEPAIVPAISDRAELAESESVVSFEGRRKVATRSVEVRNWNWKSTSLDLPAASEMVDSDRPGRVGELYDHGSRRLIEADRGDGPHGDPTPALAARRLAAISNEANTARGRGLVTSFAVGHTFTLDGHPHEALDDTTYVIKWVRHEGDCPEVERGGVSGTSSANYVNRFECVPLAEAHAPPQRQKPRIYGYQTALVVGPDGEEIHTDRLGRIKVLLHWDREQRDGAPDTSCWLRVAQMWGGSGWGTFFLPRVGMEVLVSFIDGDPDRPVVTGCLYNGANLPPYTLPDEKTKSTIKTSSSPGGDGYNELRFEDGKGVEEVFIHGQRDMNTRVRRNQSNTVGNDQRVVVHNDRSVDVTGFERSSVGKDRIRTVDGAEQVTIKGSQNIRVEGADPAGEATPPPVPGVGMHVEGTYTIYAREKLVIQVGASTSLVLTPDGITMNAPKTIDLGIPQAALSLAEGIATTEAPTIGLAASSSNLLLEDIAKLESDVQVRTEVHGSKFVCDRHAVRAEGGTALIKGTSMTSISSPVTTMISGNEVHVNGNASIAAASAGAISLSGGGITETIGGFINLGG